MLSMEYEMAVAEALCSQQLQNLNETLTRTERHKKGLNMENALRVKLHQIRTGYGVAIKPRKRHHSRVSTTPDQDQNSTRTTSQRINLPSLDTSPDPEEVLASSRPAKRPVQTRRKLHEWKRALLSGETFHHLIQRNAVFLRCHLVPNGRQHKDYFALDAMIGDPARRLGIQIQYQVPELGSTQTQTRWVTATGLGNATKSNSLVALLEGQSVNDNEQIYETGRTGGIRRDTPILSESVTGSKRDLDQVDQPICGPKAASLEVEYKYLRGTVTNATSVRQIDLNTKRGRYFQSFQVDGVDR
ncbi:hypothetical protein BJ170DRAFT_363166 [Xylariales sp. AK1849]|nr:hypothetical protein BJ170DRAFT_363166 [Xylariales sp. AK1849]